MERLQDVEICIGYSFQNSSFLEEALCHKSFIQIQKKGKHNERLEFLGDAILDAVVTDLLMKKYPQDSEGVLSKKRASLVNEGFLQALVQKWNVDQFIQTGHSPQESQLNENPRVLASLFEALVGAVYRDGGFEKTYDWLSPLFLPFLEPDLLNTNMDSNYKSRFQEWAQSLYKSAPTYGLLSQKGPPHQLTFEMGVYLDDKLWGQGQGSNKKIAEQKAAQNALEKLGL